MKNIIVLFFLFNLNSFLYAQSSEVYLIPRQIYVGDPASLIITLPATLQNDTIILTTLDSSLFPSDPNIDFHRIILEKRVTGSRLIIEFTPFIPGNLEFPVIEIGGEYFAGLIISVNSLINSSSAGAPAGAPAGAHVLSGAASVLAMPGTAVMLYGLLILLILIILLTVWFILKGRSVLQKLKERWKRHRLFVSVLNTEKRLQKALNKGTNKREILDKISDEFREFLSVLTGKNCRSMTAREFSSEFAGEFTGENNDSVFLEKFFKTCDELRFSGAVIEIQCIQKLLEDFRLFTENKYREYKTR
ncbi:MAG: hypothetical protein FWD14_03310 [Treponema sp.]|nr:hypothetical protein [Treponema sp.]